jgi:serine/threonine protein kinase
MPFTLKDYSDIRELAKGGMSRLYLATQISLKRQVVIKEMAAGLVTTKNEIKRFENEAQAGASLSHDNIIRIYDFGEEKGSFYIAMEYVDGSDLDQLLQEEDFPREIGMMILQQAVRGLAYAHEKGVVHRDVKAANVLVGRGGAVKVVDFGLAYAGAHSAQLTSTGAIVGTPVYMSPELVNGEATKDPRMDIWAAGVILYRLIAGEFPFTGENVPSTLINIIQNKEKPAEEVDKTLPSNLAAQLNACLEKDRSKRLAAFGTLIQALQDYFFEIGVRDPVDMIRRYFADKNGTIAELRALLANYHWTKGNECFAAEKHVTALAHYKEAQKRDPKNREISHAVKKAENLVAGMLTSRTAKVQEYVVTRVRSSSRQGRGLKRFLISAVVLFAVAAGVGVLFYLWKPGTFTVAVSRLLDGTRISAFFDAVRSRTDAHSSNIPVPPSREQGNTVPVADTRPDTQLDRSIADVKNSAAATPSGARDAGQSAPLHSFRDSVNAHAQLPASEPGLVRVEVNPVYAEVKIDNSDTMKLDQRSDGVWLSKGVHQFTAHADGLPSATGIATVAGNDTHFVVLNLMAPAKKPGALQIFSNIAAEIYIDGESKGSTPTTSPISLTEGDHIVVFKRPGFAQFQKVVTIKSGETKEIRVEPQAKKAGE